ncbi:hypothetical protein QBC37DRAFT_109406 [Rhypophila decipiens]|uniref:Uncharacterized protein n=1 Tax=Rhypophila decipiens TaxID=261697 RepID=A0AAN6YJD3_9PEZI|nr:hypothetical protein QBC37DRAFT_109406 [Rhypophila decipiens]
MGIGWTAGLGGLGWLVGQTVRHLNIELTIPSSVFQLLFAFVFFIRLSGLGFSLILFTVCSISLVQLCSLSCPGKGLLNVLVVFFSRFRAWDGSVLTDWGSWDGLPAGYHSGGLAVFWLYLARPLGDS